MKTELKSQARRVAANDALFRVSIKQAEAAGLDEIRISVPRAREILRDLTILKHACDAPASKTPSHFARLDAIHNQRFDMVSELNRMFA